MKTRPHGPFTSNNKDVIFPYLMMQVTADNAAREFPGKNQYNPEVSIETGVEAFTRTLSQNKGNLMQSLASYNQGKPTTSQGKAYAQWVKLGASQVPAQS